MLEDMLHMRVWMTVQWFDSRRNSGSDRTACERIGSHGHQNNQQAAPTGVWSIQTNAHMQYDNHLSIRQLLRVHFFLTISIVCKFNLQKLISENMHLPGQIINRQWSKQSMKILI